MKRIYARASRRTWIVNIPAGRLEIYTGPTGPDQKNPAYRLREDLGDDGAVPLVLDGREVARIAVRDLLP